MEEIKMMGRKEITTYNMMGRKELAAYYEAKRGLFCDRPQCLDCAIEERDLDLSVREIVRFAIAHCGHEDRAYEMAVALVPVKQLPAQHGPTTGSAQ